MRNRRAICFLSCGHRLNCQISISGNTRFILVLLLRGLADHPYNADYGRNPLATAVPVPAREMDRSVVKRDGSARDSSFCFHIDANPRRANARRRGQRTRLLLAETDVR